MRKEKQLSNVYRENILLLDTTRPVVIDKYI